MTFEVKQLNRKEFYPTFCKWLFEHNFPAISDAILPENVFVCHSDGLPIYAIWFYFTDSKSLAWLGWPVSNKNINFKKRDGGMEFLLEYVSNYAKKKKISLLFTTSNTEGVISPLLKNGFLIGDTKVNHYLKNI